MGYHVERDFEAEPPAWDLKQLLQLGSYSGLLSDGAPEGEGAFTYKSGTVVKGDFHEGRPNGLVKVQYDCGCRYKGVTGPHHDTGAWGGLGALTLNCDEHRKGNFVAWQTVSGEELFYPVGHVLYGLFDFVIGQDFWPIPTDILEEYESEDGDN